MNVLGKTGTRTSASKKKLAQDLKTKNQKVAESEGETAAGEAEIDDLKTTSQVYDEHFTPCETVVTLF